MVDRSAADRACKDPNPIIDGRKANVNLAYLGAKPRVMQPAASAAAAVAYEQYPYAASPAAPGYMATTGYGYAVQQPLATAAPGSAAAAAAAFGQYQAQQLQADRMQ
ncbi:hypothetical protein XENOCAPTIV_004799 [Xenoophorus captivus]|uniref:RNA-binding protein 24 n=1 Tax=Xenoophorus captivus TaxID=1517983 RepID=A0ABV0S5H1_9TELE